MININLYILNTLEKKIHATIMEACKKCTNISINEAALLCGCSTSKISKFVKKIGFHNYKQYLQYLQGTLNEQEVIHSEFERIKKFLERFDESLIDYLKKLINKYNRIILLGYGPTYYVLSYFEYKLRVIMHKNVLAIQDEDTAINMLSNNKTDEETLLLYFSVSGSFRDFTKIHEIVQKKHIYSAVILEEYNPKVISQCNNVIYLSEHVQPYSWRYYEKPRTFFFILVEEIMASIVREQYEISQLISADSE